MSEPLRILVVDDDAKIRTVVRRGLAREATGSRGGQQ